MLALPCFARNAAMTFPVLCYVLRKSLLGIIIIIANYVFFCNSKFSDCPPHLQSITVQKGDPRNQAISELLSYGHTDGHGRVIC